ncbi:hypothetical protein NNC19_17690 [Clostridium sp. SHJSY1]|uniref:hypothetical protein n=1 Tax=Clostridium sp. SHJSY1 TaxID=2942483 RepID=UPI00287601CE|nr:hypothetical protein [Clostridium sp. SHJSY1]MDS0527526.1 hypothetical protein [Clostridium sp. SHJSY1]
MGKKRIFGVIILLTLAFNIEGCENISIGGSSLTGISKENENTSKNNLEGQRREFADAEIIQIGSEQTKIIKEILNRYGVKTSYNAEKNATTYIAISKDENDCGYAGAKGYTIATNKGVKINDGGDHQYGIIYNAYKAQRNNEPTYVYQITMEFSAKEEFKIDNFKLFKELVKGIHGNKYDLVSLENFMKEQLKDVQSGGVVGGKTRDVGSYRECIEDGGKDLTKNTCTITYSVTLKD